MIAQELAVHGSPDQYADTIVALSTPPGRSAIGLIRLSGPEALTVALGVFHPRRATKIPERTAIYGHIVHPDKREIIDDGFLIFFKAPTSYTGEDMVELSLHGSPVVLDMVVRMVMSQGARLATRGEFTRRAFLNGKLDLSQAEAVIDLIDAQSEASARDARARLDSSPSSRVKEISDAIKNLLAEIELHLDFDEDDELGQPNFATNLQDIYDDIRTIHQHSQQASLIREGIRVCIAGKPNVGKSTLFNALLLKDRAIVTPLPGTTRDPIEDRIVLKGHTFSLWDTAGIREPEGVIEDEGIRRTRGAIDNADLVIVVLDGTTDLDDVDQSILQLCNTRRMLVVVNKIDLLSSELLHFDLPEICISRPTLWISAKTGKGIDALKHALAEEAEQMTRVVSDAADRIILSTRCVHLLDAAMIPLERAHHMCLEERYPKLDILSYELRSVLQVLEEITGERVDEGLLDRLFERFCVGK